MKKALSILCCAVPALIALLPTGKMICQLFGYDFEIANLGVLAVVSAIFCVLLTILTVSEKVTVENRVLKVLFLCLAPMSLINAVFYLIMIESIWVLISIPVSVICCLYLTLMHAKPTLLKIISLTLAVLMIFPVGFFGFLSIVFGSMGQNTVVRTVESPNGQYCAKVIDSDQGALGGDTLVDLYEDKKINAGVFKISKKPQRIYTGEWGEAQSMDIYWKDDNCLVINGVEYIIKSKV